MNYYEELGLPANASPEEVREAWRGLARLLHPDQQQDPRLRRLAECQMKRLNEIHEVLTDPVLRRRYDLSLAAGDEERAALCLAERRPVARRGLKAYWPLAGAAAAVWVTWVVATSTTRQPPGPPVIQQAPPPKVTTAAATTRPAKPARGRIGRERLAPRQTTFVLPAAAEPPLNPPAIPAEPSGPALTPSIDSAVPVALGPAPPAPAPHPPSEFAGAWVYVPPKLSISGSSLYPPEFIETVILEDDGLLRGRYHARYRIPDRAVSPEVRFQFSGKPSGDRAVLTWKGSGGSEGEIQLRLLKPDVLEVRWAASELGSQLGLASGTAVLVRRLEP